MSKHTLVQYDCTIIACKGVVIATIKLEFTISMLTKDTENIHTFYANSGKKKIATIPLIGIWLGIISDDICHINILKPFTYFI